MTKNPPIKVALVGFGGIARSHYVAYEELIRQGIPLSIVAICDSNAAQFTKQITINISDCKISLPTDIHFYTNVDDMIAQEDFDMADICLPTFLHKEISVKLLHAGKHVLCEKPMALCSADCEEMVQASKQVGKHLLIGHCLRFSPAYLYLKTCIDEGTYGKPLTMQMHRASMSPLWSAGNWLQQEEKSGGCILDTHIHDVDIAHFFFGKPQAVSTLECKNPPYWQTQNTRLFFDNLTVVIDGSWHDMPDTAFSFGCKARFEKANLIMKDDRVTVYPDGGEPFSPSFPSVSLLFCEIQYFVNLLLRDAPNTENPPEDARDSVKIIECMKQSAALGGEKLPFQA